MKKIEVFFRSFFLWMLSLRATYQLTGRCFPTNVRITSSKMRLECRRHRTATVIVKGKLELMSWLRNSEPVIICLERDARLEINGDFLLGPNCRISVNPGASLIIGGCEKERVSGFTANLLLIAVKLITIGKDFLGAWDIFITDSDHHVYGGEVGTLPVIIGDHVWATPNVSILKGAHIGADSVIAHRAVVLKGDHLAQSLLAGNPAVRIAQAKEWHP
jgi:acetyltransferase-like isoleucine patch superfamily enzyme